MFAVKLEYVKSYRTVSVSEWVRSPTVREGSKQAGCPRSADKISALALEIA
jgi:hypothetical protein